MESGHRAPSTGPKKQSPSNSYLRYTGVALQLLVTISVFGWLGYQLDQLLSITFPVFMLLFGLIALAGMLYQLYRSLNQ